MPANFGGGRFLSTTPTGSSPKIEGRASSFGRGRNRMDGSIVAREVREVINRIRWDLAESCNFTMENVAVYIEDDSCESERRLCRRFLREGTCEWHKHCKYSHDLNLAAMGARPCSKSSGSSSPLRVVSGVDIDMVMSGAMDLGLHRTMFISVCDEILWDRENEVWDDVISRFDQISLSPQVSMDSMGEEGGSTCSRSSPIPNGHPGNELLSTLPGDVAFELFRLLRAEEAGRCMLTCKSWKLKASDESVWQRYMMGEWAVPTLNSEGECWRLFGELMSACRNISSLKVEESQPSFGFGFDSPGVRRFSGHDSTVISIHVDESRDRLISCSVVGALRVYELHSSKKLGYVDLRSSISCMECTGSMAYCGSTKGSIRSIDLEDLSNVQKQKVSTSCINSISMLQGGKMVVGLGNGSLLFLNSVTLESIIMYDLPLSPSCLFVKALPDQSGRFVAFASPDQIFVWNEDQGGDPKMSIHYSSDALECLEEVRHDPNEACDVVIQMGKDLCVSACHHDLSLRWWRPDLGCLDVTEALTAKAGEGLIGTQALASIGDVVLSSHMMGTIVIWHKASRYKVWEYTSWPRVEHLVMTTHGILAAYERVIVHSFHRLMGADIEQGEEKFKGREGKKKDKKPKPNGPRRKKGFAIRKNSNPLYY